MKTNKSIKYTNKINATRKTRISKVKNCINKWTEKNDIISQR